MSHLSLEERKIYTEAFLEYDTNGDGVVDFEEFVNSDFGKLGFKEDEKEQILKIAFENLDTNKDGKLSLDEHLQACGNLDPETRALAETRRMFQTLDLDLDGKISEEEFFLYVQEKGSSLTRQQVHAMFQCIDTDPDGKLSAKQFFQTVL